MNKSDLKDWTRDMLEAEIINMNTKNFHLQNEVNNLQESNGKLQSQIESLKSKFNIIQTVGKEFLWAGYGKEKHVAPALDINKPKYEIGWNDIREKCLNITHGLKDASINKNINFDKKDFIEDIEFIIQKHPWMLYIIRNSND